MYHFGPARAELIPSTILLRVAGEAERVDQQIHHAHSLAEEIQRVYDRLRDLERKISGADRVVAGFGKPNLQEAVAALRNW